MNYLHRPWGTGDSLAERAYHRNRAWEGVKDAVDALAFADGEALSQAYRCGVLIRLGAPQSLADRFTEPLMQVMATLVQPLMYPGLYFTETLGKGA